jgi:hypothetical protein
MSAVRYLISVIPLSFPLVVVVLVPSGFRWAGMGKLPSSFKTAVQPGSQACFGCFVPTLA